MSLKACEEKNAKIWFNGELVEWRDAKIHILTHALHYGSSVFEGIRAYRTKKGTAIFRLTDHMKRLINSAKIYYMDIPYSLEELVEAAKEVVRVNNFDSCYIRPIVFRGYGVMGLNPLQAPIEVAIAAWPWGAYLGEEGIKNGVRAKISSIERIGVNTLPPQAKAGGQYINSILAKLEALNCGFDEAIMLDQNGYISEGSGENIFVVKNGVIYTPPVACSILEGITRNSVTKIAEELGYDVRERFLVRSDLYLADEAFFTGTAAEVVPIREVDNHPIPQPWPILRKIQERFYGILRGEIEDKYGWMEYI